MIIFLKYRSQPEIKASFCCFGLVVALYVFLPTHTLADDSKVEKIVCPKEVSKLPAVSRSDVYKNTPYKQGELAEYKVSHSVAHVGSATMEVRRPYKYKGVYKSPIWHRSFHLEGKTGDWYRYIFVAHDSVDSLVRSWDYGVSKFYLSQDESHMFGKHLIQQKWLEFDHAKCKVEVRVLEKGKKEKKESFDLAPGALDTLGIVYWLREQTYKVGEKKRALVYSSKKNWWLEAIPLKEEEIKVVAGTYKAMKIKLQTYIGDELQQKGDVFVWIDIGTKERPMLMVKGNIKLGSVWIEMTKLKPGR